MGAILRVYRELAKAQSSTRVKLTFRPSATIIRVVLCPVCRIHTRRGFPFCLRCGHALAGTNVAAFAPAQLTSPMSPDAYPLGGSCTSVGRNADNDLVIDDPYVSRYHARIWRQPEGYRLEDLDSLNGTFCNGERLVPGAIRPLNDHDLLGIGPTVSLRFQQPRSSEMGGRTVYGAPGPSMLSATGFGPVRAEPPVHDPMAFRPRRRGPWALKQVATKDNTPVRFVLRNETTNAHLLLTERDVFLWNLMDGRQTVRDLLLAYAEEYGQLALPRIQQLIGQLRGAGLVSEPKVVGAGRPPRRSVGDELMAVLTRAELSIAGIDEMLDRLYQSIGWRFFTRLGLAVLWLLVAGGLGALTVAMGRQRLFDVGGAGPIGAVLVILGYMAGITLHELGHAIAVKSYGRQVRRGGFMLMLGMPYAFVDTTQMWFEGKWPRIIVSLAGPIVTLAFAGIFSLAAAFVPDPVVSGISFQVALGLYTNTLFNFNPLITLDGYYALSDLVGMPHLREESTSYVMHHLLRDVVSRKLGLRQFGMTIYGVAALIATVAFLVLGIYMWNQRLRQWVHQLLPSPLDQLAVYGLLLLLFFPVWYPVAARLFRSVRQRMAPSLQPAAAN